MDGEKRDVAVGRWADIRLDVSHVSRNATRQTRERNGSGGSAKTSAYDLHFLVNPRMHVPPGAPTTTQTNEQASKRCFALPLFSTVRRVSQENSDRRQRRRRGRKTHERRPRHYTCQAESFCLRDPRQRLIIRYRKRHPRARESIKNNDKNKFLSLCYLRIYIRILSTNSARSCPFIFSP